ncbi:MAG: hypothetical protein AAGF99_12515 [Bacteroidota bacterium]
MTRPLVDINRDGHAALVRALGVVDAFRFLRQFDTGRGDYTAERHTWIGEVSLDDLVAEAREIDAQREVE